MRLEARDAWLSGLLLFAMGIHLAGQGCRDEDPRQRARAIMDEHKEGYRSCAELNEEAQATISEGENALANGEGERAIELIDRADQLLADAMECNARWRTVVQRHLDDAKIPMDVVRQVWKQWIKENSE